MSYRRCCCQEVGGPGCCFSFELTASHWQATTLSCTVTTCNIPVEGNPSCDQLESFGVQNLFTAACGLLQPQQFVVSTPPAGPDQLCECYDQVCTYTWTPPYTTFTRQVSFTLGCSPTLVPQSSTTGSISVGIRDAPPCPGTAFCGCCGVAGDPSVVSIGYWDVFTGQTVSGACGTAPYSNGGFNEAWSTQWTAHYCWDPDVPCLLTLKKIEVTGQANALPSYGPGAFGTNECDCENNTVTSPGTTCVTSACAPFTGPGEGALYALAGSPPMTISGTPCAC